MPFRVAKDEEQLPEIGGLVSHRGGESRRVRLSCLPPKFSKQLADSLSFKPERCGDVPRDEHRGGFLWPEKFSYGCR